jgi:hypothetical protein
MTRERERISEPTTGPQLPFALLISAQSCRAGLRSCRWLGFADRTDLAQHGTELILDILKIVQDLENPRSRLANQAGPQFGRRLLFAHVWPVNG